MWPQLIIALAPTLIAQLPKLISADHPAANVAAQPDVQKQFIILVQTAINVAKAMGLIDINAPLVVDGIAGPKTMTAFKTILEKYHVTLPNAQTIT